MIPEIITLLRTIMAITTLLAFLTGAIAFLLCLVILFQIVFRPRTPHE